MVKFKETPRYIKNLLLPTSQKQRSRRVWSIDLESVWIPFFTATNTMGDTAIPLDALGSPLRLAYDKDGSVKFSPAGRPVIRVAKPISENVALIRDNFVANLQQYAEQVAIGREADYATQVQLSHKAGAPIIEHDRVALSEAIQAQLEQAMSEAETTPETEAEVTPETEAEVTPETEAEKEKELVTA